MSEFIDCPSCAAKPGSPTLCPSCINNRDLIDALRKENQELQKEIIEFAGKTEDAIRSEQRTIGFVSKIVNDLFNLARNDKGKYLQGDILTNILATAQERLSSCVR